MSGGGGGVGWGGWGGGVGWGGVGWGGRITSLARPHIRDATLVYALLHFFHIHTYVMLRPLDATLKHVSCTCPPT